MTRVLLSGNEAIARGAYEYGVKVATGYPGTPSSEILENVARYKEIYSEWSVNEKVAMDVAIGAAYAEQRAMVTMKQVGMNAAADSFFYAVCTGVKGGCSSSPPTTRGCSAPRTSRTTATMPASPRCPC